MNTYVNNVSTMNQIPFEATLSDPRWNSKKKEILERDQYRCVNCKSEKNLEIHLRQYHFSMSLKLFRKPWDYESNLMITLCESCHKTGHQLYQVPVKHIH